VEGGSCEKQKKEDCDRVNYGITNAVMNSWFSELVRLLTAPTAHLQVEDGSHSLHIFRVVLAILNQQSSTADKGWCSNFGVRWRVKHFTIKIRML
jgi:hypothetical protein